MRNILLLFLLSSLTTCAAKPVHKPSFVLIGLERLPVDQTICDTSEDEAADSGLAILCSEAVRFSHVFTPSTMSQAGMTSVLTALYPFEHHVEHNGSNYLSEKILSVGELAASQDYRTAFFSGGGSIWRKSGLAQGFEVFDDSFPININSYYREAKISFQSFLSWLDHDVKEQPFFGVFYLPDLQFTTIPGENLGGEVLESSYDGKWQATNESLYSFIEGLKKRGRWEDTYFIFFGLNGRTNKMRTRVLPATNLLAENVQVSFFVKPANPMKNKPLNSKIDENFSLVDLGYSIFDLMQKEKAPQSQLERRSMFRALARDESTNSEDRVLYVESAWPKWFGLSNKRVSLRYGPYMVLLDNKKTLYNSLLDRTENNPQNIQNLASVSYLKPIQNTMDHLQIASWNPLPTETLLKYRIAKRLWDPIELYKDHSELDTLYKATHDAQILDWYAGLSLREQNWSKLFELGKLAGNINYQVIAKYNLKNESPNLKELHAMDPCLALFFQRKEAEILKKCDDDEVETLHSWIQEKSTKKEAQRESFLRHYVDRKIEENIQKLDLFADSSWDIPANKPSGPSISDLVLSLSKYKVYSILVNRRMERIQNENIIN